MKNVIGILLLLIGGLATYFILIDDKVSSISTEKSDLKNFAIEDTASIRKIFMSQPNGKSILLNRDESGTWLVEDQFPARTDAIFLILKTVHDIQIMGSVPENKLEHTIKRLATAATKVEFYTDGKQPEKTWYIGDPSESKLGTYMLLEEDNVKSSSPYATHLLMERGYLGTRFFIDQSLWKDRFLLKTKVQEIKKITVSFTADTTDSYSITQEPVGEFKITNLTTGELRPLPREIAVPYFKEFSSVYYEYIDVKTEENTLDSIYSVFPRHKIEIELLDGKKELIKTYNMPVREGATLGGKPITYHPERMYTFSSYMGKEVHPIVQNLTFDVLTPNIGYFESLTTVEK